MNGATVPSSAVGPAGGGSSGGGGRRLFGRRILQGVTVAPFRELFQAGLDASWEMDIFGGTRRNIEAAGADLQAAVEDRRDVLVTLVGDVGSNYINLRGFQQQLDIARENLEAQKHNADIIQKRHDAGFVGGLDVANAKAQVATTEATIPHLRVLGPGGHLQPGGAVGPGTGRPGERPGQGRPRFLPPRRRFPVGLPSELLRRRPDIRRAEAQIHAATARIGVATADLFPKFSLTGTFGFSASDLPSWGIWPTVKFWSFGPSVTWPIFAGGRIWCNIKVQDALRSKRC